VRSDYLPSSDLPELFRFPLSLSPRTLAVHSDDDGWGSFMSNCDWYAVGTVERTSTRPIYQTIMASMRFTLTIVAVLAILVAMASAQDTIVVNPPPANPQPGPPGPPGPPSGGDTIVVNPPPGGTPSPDRDVNVNIHNDNPASTVAVGLAATVAAAILLFN
jgi:hypothetical protein